MDARTQQLPKSREALAAELTRNRQESLKASERGDFRTVARLTMEAARLNREIEALLPRE